MLKWIGYALLAFCLLVLLTAVLNNMHWSYYHNGVVRVDTALNNGQRPGKDLPEGELNE